MKSYPSIINTPEIGKTIYAFDKLDGSNLRAEWSKKKGFYKFGTRNHLFDETDLQFGEGKELFLNSYEEELSLIFKSQRWDKAICFFEYFGPNSFAGSHIQEPHEVILFDVATNGLLEPKTFLDLFGHLKCASLLYQGPITTDFIDSVLNRTLKNMTFEGVVCKGGYETPGVPWMCKIKSEEWISKVKEKFGKDSKRL